MYALSPKGAFCAKAAKVESEARFHATHAFPDRIFLFPLFSTRSSFLPASFFLGPFQPDEPEVSFETFVQQLESSDRLATRFAESILKVCLLLRTPNTKQTKKTKKNTKKPKQENGGKAQFAFRCGLFFLITFWVLSKKRKKLSSHPGP
jgi:hypothetical protein